MVVVVLIVLGVACVVAGWLSGSVILAYIALAFSLVGLATIIMCTWHGLWSRSVSSEDSDTATVEPDLSSTANPVALDELEEEAETVSDGATGGEEIGSFEADNDGWMSSAGAGDVEDRVRAVSVGADSEDSTEKLSAYVIPGRHRFHLAGCVLVSDVETEVLTLVEAREEGFTACTRCAYDRG